MLNSSSRKKSSFILVKHTSNVFPFCILLKCYSVGLSFLVMLAHFLEPAMWNLHSLKMHHVQDVLLQLPTIVTYN